MAEENNNKSTEAEGADVVSEKKDIPEQAEEAPKTKEPDDSSAGENVEVPAKFKKLVDEVEKMTVLELHELVKILEKKFGVSAQAAAAPATGGESGEEEEKDSFTVELKSSGEKKIAVIKAVKDILGLGLKDAKDMVDGAPTVLKEGVKKEEAEEIKQKIEGAGGSVELK